MKTVTKVKIRESWAIQDITFDEKTLILSVHMMEGTKGQGKTLRYADVPKRVFEEFISAESKGKFFNSRIRNTYPYLGD